MKIEQTLQALGLTEKEAKIYLALLQLGQASAYATADHSGIKRPTAYVILEELIQKGLVARVPRTRKKLFVAQSPEEYFAALEDKLDTAKRSLPELLALANKNENKPKVLYFEGLKGFREAAWSKLKRDEKNLVGFYAGYTELSDELRDVITEYNQEFKKRGFKERGIITNDPLINIYRERDKDLGRTMKVLPKSEYSSKVWIDIGDTFTLFLAPKHKQGILIENKEIAEAMKQIFELVWKARAEKPQGATEN